MPVKKREIFGWGMYDFANSAFATTILAVIFNNAFLPEISTDQSIGRISGLGWALGYVGGGALLAINLMMLKHPQWLGFPAGYFTVQDCFFVS